MTSFNEFLVPEFRDVETFDAVRICLDIDKIVIFQEMIPEIRESYIIAMIRKQKNVVDDFAWDIGDDEVYQKIYAALEDSVFVELENGVKICLLISYKEMKQVMKSGGLLASEIRVSDD
jgi:hypothetical protein